MSRPDYSVMTINDGGQHKSAVRWRGKMDPVAVCDESRDAQRIVDALNREQAQGSRHKAQVWNWIRVEEKTPGNRWIILVFTEDEEIERAIFIDGFFYQLGQEFTEIEGTVSHWIDPQLP